MKEKRNEEIETQNPVESSVLLGYITVQGFHLEHLPGGEIVAHPSTPAQQLMSIKSLIGTEPLKQPLSILLEAAIPENLPKGCNLRWVDGDGAVQVSVGSAELAT